MNKEELDLLENVFTLAIGECAYNDINNIQKLEDKIKTINNLCKKQKEVIDKITDLIKQYGKYDGEKCTRGFQMWSADFNKMLEVLKVESDE